MATIRCPICQRMFDTAKSTAMPFCCDRCRQIDLGRWLKESYGVPTERQDGPQDEAGWSPTSE